MGAVVIRMMREDDERAIRRLVMRYLKETYDQGGDFPPTLENAAAFTAYAIQGAAIGDPCLVADDNGAVVGVLTARGVVFPGMTMRDKTVRSWGTYVLPAYRSQGTGLKLFIVAGHVARMRGYTRILGMTHGTDYTAHAMSLVGRIRGLQEVGKVLVLDLARKAREQALVEDAPSSSLPADVVIAPVDLSDMPCGD